MSDRTTEFLGANIAGDPAEPSMEDILASIRRIIADDGDAAQPEGAVAAETAKVDTHVDVRDYAAVSPVVTDQNAVLVEAEKGRKDQDVDLDDILILSDDDFAADDLKIPAVEILDDDISDDILIDIDEVLSGETDSLIINAKDIDAKNNSAASLLPGFDGSAKIDPAISLMDLEGDVTEAPKSLASKTPPMMDLSDDIDLILDDEHYTPALAENDVKDSSEILGLVEAGIADIEKRQADEDATVGADLGFSAIDKALSGNQSGDLTAPFYNEEGKDDDVIDLVGDLLAKADAYEEVDTPVKSEIYEAAAVADLPQDEEIAEIETISGSDDIDLVKSLMADLMGEDLSDDEDVVDVPGLDVSGLEAPTVPEEQIDPILESENPEGDFVDDIIDLAIADELAIAEETAAQNESVESPEMSSDAVAGTDILPVEPSVSDIEHEKATALGEDMNPEESVESVDASINALLQIAASAERDALTAPENVPSILPETTADDIIPQDENVEVEEAIDVAMAEDDIDTTDEMITEDVDAALLPETRQDNDGLDDLLSAGLDDVSEAPTVFDEASAYETILPEPIDNVDVLSADSDNGLVAAALTSDTSLEDDIFGASDIDAVDNDFENVLPVDDVLAETTEISPPSLEQEPTEMPKLVAKDGIIDDVTEAATMEAFASLNQVVDENTEYQQSGPRIGDLVQDALKPMLKDWLDENLKAIVERAVTKEVKRISSGK